LRRLFRNKRWLDGHTVEGLAVGPFFLELTLVDLAAERIPDFRVVCMGAGLVGELGHWKTYSLSWWLTMTR
jgi:hypothetical protein